jgi:hypothetical protein
MMGAHKAIQAAQRDINKYAGILRAKRVGAFHTTTDAVNGVYGNLATTTSGYAKNLSAEQARQLGALQRLRSNTQQLVGRTRRGTVADVQQTYGSAVAGGQAATGFATGKAVAKAGRTAIGAQVGAAGILARGSEAAMGALQAGVGAESAGAQALTADALAYRGKQDAATIAASQLALDQMVLQNKLDIENYKAKLKLADAANNTNGAMTAVATTAASATQDMWDGFNHYVDPATGQPITGADAGRIEIIDGKPTLDGKPVIVPNAAGVAQTYMQLNGIDPASSQGQVIQSIATAMAQAGAGKAPGAYANDPQVLVDAVNQQMAMLYPQFGKYQATIDSLITAQFGITMGQAPNVGAAATHTPPDTGILSSFGQKYLGGVAAGAIIGTGAVLSGGQTPPLDSLHFGRTISAADRAKLKAKGYTDAQIDAAVAAAP